MFTGISLLFGSFVKYVWHLNSDTYFVMMGLLTLYTTMVEQGCYLIALDKDKAGLDPDNVWRLTSNLKKYTRFYSYCAVFCSALLNIKYANLLSTCNPETCSNLLVTWTLATLVFTWHLRLDVQFIDERLDSRLHLVSTWSGVPSPQTGFT